MERARERSHWSPRLLFFLKLLSLRIVLLSRISLGGPWNSVQDVTLLPSRLGTDCKREVSANRTGSRRTGRTSSAGEPPRPGKVHATALSCPPGRWTRSDSLSAPGRYSTSSTHFSYRHCTTPCYYRSKYYPREYANIVRSLSNVVLKISCKIRILGWCEVLRLSFGLRY